MLPGCHVWFEDLNHTSDLQRTKTISGWKRKQTPDFQTDYNVRFSQVCVHLNGKCIWPTSELRGHDLAKPSGLELISFFLWLSFWADLHRLQLILKIIVCESLALSSSSRSQSFTPCVSFAGPERWRNLRARETEFTADFLDHEKVWKRAATPQQDNEKPVAAAWLLCHRGVE